MRNFSFMLLLPAFLIGCSIDDVIKPDSTDSSVVGCQKVTNLDEFKSCAKSEHFTKLKLEIIDRQFADDVALKSGDNICVEKPFYIRYDSTEQIPFVIAEFTDGKLYFWKTANGKVLDRSGGFIKFEKELKAIYGFALPKVLGEFLSKNYNVANWNETLKEQNSKFSKILFQQKEKVDSCLTLTYN